MPTGLRAEPGPHVAPGVPKPTPTERDSASALAQAEARRLRDRQRDLPDLMREAAAGGRFEAVARLRAEWEQLPLRLWAAEYTAVQAELADVAKQRRPGEAHPRRLDLLERARELAMEIRPGLAKPTMTPGVR
jgi:hypothetical protein